jgi:hypothetical protein
VGGRVVEASADASPIICKCLGKHLGKRHAGCRDLCDPGTAGQNTLEIRIITKNCVYRWG